MMQHILQEMMSTHLELILSCNKCNWCDFESFLTKCLRNHIKVQEPMIQHIFEREWSLVQTLRVILRAQCDLVWFGVLESYE